MVRTIRTDVFSGARGSRLGALDCRALAAGGRLVLTVTLAVPVGLFAGASSAPARAEVIEAVVARINDDIITKTDLSEAEQESVSDIYSRYTGDTLDKELARARTDL